MKQTLYDCHPCILYLIPTKTTLKLELKNENILLITLNFSKQKGVSCKLYRGSYISAHVLFNLLNELGKRDKMWGLSSILPLFCNKFNKFNNTRAQMLDSIYHMTLRLLWNLISAVKTL